MYAYRATEAKRTWSEHVMACSHQSHRDWNGEARREETYQSQAGVKTLLEDGVCWVEDEFGEEELVASFVHLFGCKPRWMRSARAHHEMEQCAASLEGQD